MKKGLLFLCLIGLIVACSSSDGDGNEGGNNYDRTALLTNWADNIIIPGYEAYQSKVSVLNTNTASFTAVPTVGNLQALRSSWLEAYKAYQYVAIYNIGKAELISFKESTNTYPTDVDGINANISNNSYNLALQAQFVRQGFPALDYLINGIADSDSAITAMYISDSRATSRKQYLAAVAARLQTSIDAIVTDWNSTYRDTYIAGNGTSVSSSVSKTTNNFVKNFERDIRSAKVGIPAGKLSGGATLPQSVEAYYQNHVSQELLTLSLQASKDFFNGKHFDSATTGPSLKAYLDYVSAVRDGVNLSDIINSQFTTSFNAVSTLNNSFSQQIITDNSKMLVAYDAIQQNLIYIKLDMMQALNITIDYVDGDGD